MIEVKKIVNSIKEKLKEKVKNAKNPKGLAIILVGEDPGSQIYVKNKLKDAEEIGVKATLYKFTEDEVSQKDLEDLVNRLNNNDSIGGIVIQSPLPKKFNEEKLVNMVLDEKDVDGFKASSKYIPATPKGVLAVLDSIGCKLDGADVVLIGRGTTVGRPLIDLLLERNATLTVCHSHTNAFSLKHALSYADVVISAVGKPEFITKDMFLRDDTSAMSKDEYNLPIILDVGISRVDGKQVGDVSKEVHEINPNCTPWTNGIGLMTRTMLFQNLLED